METLEGQEALRAGEDWRYEFGEGMVKFGGCIWIGVGLCEGLHVRDGCSRSSPKLLLGVLESL